MVGSLGEQLLATGSRQRVRYFPLPEDCLSHNVATQTVEVAPHLAPLSWQQYVAQKIFREWPEKIGLTCCKKYKEHPTAVKVGAVVLVAAPILYWYRQEIKNVLINTKDRIAGWWKRPLPRDVYALSHTPICGGIASIRTAISLRNVDEQFASTALVAGVGAVTFGLLYRTCIRNWFCPPVATLSRNVHFDGTIPQASEIHLGCGGKQSIEMLLALACIPSGIRRAFERELFRFNTPQEVHSYRAVHRNLPVPGYLQLLALLDVLLEERYGLTLPFGAPSPAGWQSVPNPTILQLRNRLVLRETLRANPQSQLNHPAIQDHMGGALVQAADISVRLNFIRTNF